ncbi:MAG: OmpA family protein [Rickettsiales bacterium]|nr:OmpA family protein [Rickettsiales bacterium]
MHRLDDFKTFRTSRQLLLTTACIMALVSGEPALARSRFFPSKPSVEVYSEALEALRRTVPLQSGTSPVGVRGSRVPFGVATPAPPQPIAAAPVVKKAAPKPVAPKASTPKPQPVKKAAAPATPKPIITEAAPVMAPIPVPLPTAAPEQQFEQMLAPDAKPDPKAPTLGTPTLEIAPPVIEKSDPSAPSLAQPLKEESSKSGEEAPTPEMPAPEMPALEIQPSMEPAPVEPALEMPPAPSSKAPETPAPEMPAPALPEPDLNSMEFEPFPEIASPTPSLSETTPAPKAEKASKKENAASATKKEVPAPEMPAPEMPAPEMSAPEMVEAPPIPDIATPVAPDSAKSSGASDALIPPVPAPEDAPSLQALPAAPPKDEGMFPTLKKKIYGFFGKEAQPETTVASAPSPAAPEPAMNEPAMNEPAMNEPVLNEPVMNEPVMNDSAPEMPAPEMPAPERVEAPEMPSDMPALPPLPDDASMTAPALPSLNAAPQAPRNEALEIVKRQQIASENTGLPSLPDKNAKAAPKLTELPDAVPPSPKVSTAVEPVIENEIASLPPTLAPSEAPSQATVEKDAKNNGDKSLTVSFAQAETEVPMSVQGELKDLAKRLVEDTSKNVTVIAYASAPDEQSSLARRVSLARALAVRAFLIDLGVDNIRINIQPLGNKIPAGSGDSERADIFVK